MDISEKMGYAASIKNLNDKIKTLEIEINTLKEINNALSNTMILVYKNNLLAENIDEDILKEKIKESIKIANIKLPSNKIKKELEITDTHTEKKPQKEKNYDKKYT